MEEVFFKQPESFTKHSPKELLAYALGAALYMPATKATISSDIIQKKYPELTSIVIDLEDAVGDVLLANAEQNLLNQLAALANALSDRIINSEDLPLIFVRVRNPAQLKRISEELGEWQSILTGYVFPKFSTANGEAFLQILKEQNRPDRKLYAMPILESPQVIYKESRMDELLSLTRIMDNYNDLILNIRIGATDFCGLFGIRRDVDTTIYDVSIIRDCISDIINLFTRQSAGYVISGPVWEYFSNEHRILKPTLRTTPFQAKYGKTGIQMRSDMIDQYIDGLINEVILDKLNGIIGKTIIHPTHIKPVHSLYVVTHEEYMDATSILSNGSGMIGVEKSSYSNKMNEIKPHMNWAKKILLRAKAFGVFHPDHDFTSLLLKDYQAAEILEVN
ncbi:HpcH/HpaI aldolase/citrate lyase family protein [Bacillus sp. 1P06AnD]